MTGCKRCAARSRRTRSYALQQWKRQNPPTFASDYIWFLVAAVIVGLDVLVSR